MTEKKHRKKSLLTYILLFINSLLIIALVCSYFSLYVDPEIISFFAFFGLFYPLILLLNAIMIVVWIILWKRYFLLSLFFIFLGWNVMSRHCGLNSDCETLPVNSFKLMSFNVQNLANNNLHRQDKAHREKIFDAIRKEKPDLLCMQEFYYSGSGQKLLIDKLEDKLSLPYSYRKNYFRSKSKIHALITMSKFPIISEGYVKNNGRRVLLIFTDINIYGDTIRLLNMHMQSFRFRQKDLDFVNELGKSSNNKEFREESRNIIRRLHNAYTLRSGEAEIFSEFLETSPYPVVLCCDLNDTPASYTYHKVAGSMNDAFRTSGSGIGKTYTGNFLPLRIDYILYDDEFQSCNYNTHDNYQLSDHYPVSCFLYFREQ